MRRSLLLSVILTFCFFNFAMAARAEENADDFMQMHNIEINWHTAQTTKNISLMLSLFTDDATLTVGGKNLHWQGPDQAGLAGEPSIQAAEPICSLHAALSLQI